MQLLAESIRKAFLSQFKKTGISISLLIMILDFLVEESGKSVEVSEVRNLKLIKGTFSWLSRRRELALRKQGKLFWHACFSSSLKIDYILLFHFC